jgi:hypothetical protein
MGKIDYIGNADFSKRFHKVDTQRFESHYAVESFVQEQIVIVVYLSHKLKEIGPEVGVIVMNELKLLPKHI